MRAPTVGHIRSPNQKLGAIDPRAPVSGEPCVMLQRVLQRQRRSIALCMLYACYTLQSQRNVLIKQC